MDDTAVKYLLWAELKKKKEKEEEEEEEERKQELADEVLDDKLEAEFDALMAIGHLTSRQEARLSAVIRERVELIERRKRRRVARKSKKRRKKKLPRTCRLPRQWHVRKAGDAGCAAPRVMLPSFVDTTKMLGILVGMDQNDSFLCALRRQRQLHGQRWFYWLRYTSCVFSFVGRPVVFGIMAGMDQKVCCETALVVGSGMSMAGFAGFFTSRCVPFPGSQAHDARHHGRFDSGEQGPRGVHGKLGLLGIDVICFRIRLVGSTVDTVSCQSKEAWFSTSLCIWQSIVRCSVFAFGVQD